MEIVSISAAATAIATHIDWRAIVKKCLSDSASDAAKAGRTKFLRRFQPAESQKIAKQAVLLFTDEFLKELDDKSPLSAARPGYQDQFKRLLESAAPYIVEWFQPDVKDVDLTPLSDMWSGMSLDPLPEDFDWKFVAQNYGRAIRQYVKRDPELRQQLAVALQRDSHDFDQRFAPGFDLGAYRDFLQKKCALLQLSPLHASAYNRRIGLWNVFVPQSVRESAPAREIPRELRRQMREEGHLSGEAEEADFAQLREAYQSSPVLPVFDLLERQRLLVLLGDPGSGKTSLLKYLVLRWATEDRGNMPLWIDLKEYSREPVGLKQYLESGQSCFGLDSRSVEEQLRDGKAALYLDGLDEIFDAPTRGSVIEQVAAFCARYPQTQIIVTSRIIGYEPDRLRNAGFAHATLEDFNDGQVSEFLVRWNAIAELDDPKEALRLQTRLRLAIDESRAIRELAGNPLLLTMMAILNRNQELPRDRVELYREASRVLLHEWDASRSLTTDKFARQEKEALLRELAGAMQETQSGLAGNLIERERLHRIFRDFLKALGIEDAYSTAQALVQQLTERNFILCFAGADRFAFVHRTFLEYFSAAWFVDQFEKRRTLSLDQLRDEVFGQHWQDENWHEVLRLIAGMLGEKQAEELIRFLISFDGRAQKYANFMLAAGCLSDVRNRRAIRETDDALRQQFVDKVIRFDPPYYYELWEEWEETSPTRTKAVNWIASLWHSQETHDWLVSAATGDHDWIVRAAAVQELAHGWKDERLPWLKARAGTDDAIPVCTAAIREVSRGWKDDPDTLVWLKDLASPFNDDQLRVVAVQELARGWKDDAGTLPWLTSLATSDESAPVRVAAVRELAQGWKGQPSTPPLLKDRAQFDPHHAVRRTALQELAQGWRESALGWLKSRTGEQSSVRVAAVQEFARGWKNDPGTPPWLQECALSDSNEFVRAAAVQELARGWRNDPGMLPWLKERARSDSDAVVRVAAIQGMARWWRSDPGTLRWLKERIWSETNSSVRAAAVQELARGWKHDADTMLCLQELARSDQAAPVRIEAIHELARGWPDNPCTLLLLKDRVSSDPVQEVRNAALRDLSPGWKDDPEVAAMLTAGEASAGGTRMLSRSSDV